MTEAEFKAAKAVLLEIVQDPNSTPKIKLRATEDLLALIDRYEGSKWTVV